MKLQTSNFLGYNFQSFIRSSYALGNVSYGTAQKLHKHILQVNNVATFLKGTNKHKHHSKLIIRNWPEE